MAYPKADHCTSLLYLLYNHNLPALADTHTHYDRLGFVDFVMLLMAVANLHKLSKMVSKS